MRRGDIVTIASHGHYTGKPRPAIAIQADFFHQTNSITVLLVTTRETNASLLRVGVSADVGSGLASPSWAMIDKIVTIRRSAVGKRIGTVDPPTMLEIERRLAVFLGIA